MWKIYKAKKIILMNIEPPKPFGPHQLSRLSRLSPHGVSDRTLQIQ